MIARLNWLWPQIAGEQQALHGVKIDVQGMELKVLQGMTNLLKLFRPKRAVEFHRGVSRNEVLDLLEAAGYARLGVPVEPVEGESEPPYVDDRSYAFLAKQCAHQCECMAGGGKPSRHSS